MTILREWLHRLVGTLGPPGPDEYGGENPEARWRQRPGGATMPG
jgi:hypothetical protein